MTEVLPDWDILDRRLLADRSPFARVYDEDVRLPDGTVISQWLRVELPAFIIVFTVLEDGSVPFVRQYRQGARTWTLELPAGHIEDGEEMLTAAQRELREEAGIAADEWQYLGKYIMDANRDCGWCHAYLARGSRRIIENPDSGDVGDFSLHWLPLDDVRRRWLAGEFISAPTSLAIGLALAQL
ncbi:MAG: NUDIX hydrolase [Anaerolineae bacterium]|nr:NUDIX hydrolase [Anaerolineae bacterium]